MQAYPETKLKTTKTMF